MASLLKMISFGEGGGHNRPAREEGRGDLEPYNDWPNDEGVCYAALMLLPTSTNVFGLVCRSS
jgi:hypothetical protein